MISQLRDYRIADARADLVAGLVLTALVVPAGMGYAEAAGLPAVTGLHASIVALIAYALVGPSPVLVVAPDSSLAPIIATAIAPIADGDIDRAVAAAGLLAVLTGCVLLLGGIARLGFVADLLSKPIRLGYLAGVALLVIASQLPKLFGFSVDSDRFVPQLRDFVEGVADGATNTTAVTIGLGALVVAVGLRRFAPRAPAFLVAIAGASLVVWAFGLRDDLPVVGRLERGAPRFSADDFAWADVRTLTPAAIGLAVVAFADSGVLSRTMALRRGTFVDESQEMRAVGFTNVAVGALGGFPVSASSSRTPAAEAAGARTQMTAVVAALTTALLLLVAPNVTSYLPSSALGAVVIVAAFGLVDVPGIARLARIRRGEFAAALSALVGVALLGVLPGIGIAIGLSLLTFVGQAWRPYATELVRVDGRKGYHDVSRHPEGHRIPGLVIARFDAPLFFANGSGFDDFVRGLVDRAPEPARWVIVAAEPITDVDTTAADELAELHDHLRARGIHLAFAEMKGPVKDRLERYGIADLFPQYPTIGTAVDGYIAATGTPWVDWEERSEYESGERSEYDKKERSEYDKRERSEYESEERSDEAGPGSGV